MRPWGGRTQRQFVQSEPRLGRWRVSADAMTCRPTAQKDGQCVVCDTGCTGSVAALEWLPRGVSSSSYRRTFSRECSGLLTDFERYHSWQSDCSIAQRYTNILRTIAMFDDGQRTWRPGFFVFAIAILLYVAPAAAQDESETGTVVESAPIYSHARCNAYPSEDRGGRNCPRGHFVGRSMAPGEIPGPAVRPSHRLRRREACPSATVGQPAACRSLAADVSGVRLAERCAGRLAA